MRYDAEIRIFDMLDQVHMSVRLWATDGLSHEAPRLVLEEARTLPGVGESRSTSWLADALCPYVEDLWIRETPAGETGAPW
jgi:hypothetical protein